MDRISRESFSGGRHIPAAFQHRRGRSLTGILRDGDENLDLFSRNRRSLSIASSDESDVSTKLGRISIGSAKPVRSGMDDLLMAPDGGKHDYDWLLTPPGTPLLSSTDVSEPQPSFAAPRSSLSVRSVSNTKASRLSMTQSENNHSTRPARSSSVTRPSISSTHNNSHFSNSNRTSILNTSSASVTSSSRPSTPTNRSTLHASSRPSVQSTRPLPARSPTPAKSRPPEKSRPSINSRPSTPTARSQAPANLNAPVARSSPRSSTPTRRNPAPVNTPPSGRSSSVGRVPISNGRNPAPLSRGSSPGPRPRPQQKPITLPDFPLDAPPNLRTTLPDRPVSAGRTRPGASVTVRANNETSGTTNPTRRQSSSPIVSRGRLPELSGRARSNGVNRPGISPPEVQKPVKSAAVAESTGFGRTISKKSLDMALRHMDIRHGTGGIRPLSGTTLFPQSIRSNTPKGRPARVSDALVSTTSNGTITANGNVTLLENGNGMSKLSDHHEINSYNVHITPKESEPDPYGSSRYDAILLKEDSKNTNWLHSLEDKSDQGLVFDHRFEPLPEPFGLL